MLSSSSLAIFFLLSLLSHHPNRVSSDSHSFFHSFFLHSLHVSTPRYTRALPSVLLFSTSSNSPAVYLLSLFQRLSFSLSFFRSFLSAFPYSPPLHLRVLQPALHYSLPPSNLPYVFSFLTGHPLDFSRSLLLLASFHSFLLLFPACSCVSIFTYFPQHACDPSFPPTLSTALPRFSKFIYPYSPPSFLSLLIQLFTCSPICSHVVFSLS